MNAVFVMSKILKIDVIKYEFDVMQDVSDVIRVPSVKTSLIVVKALIERV